MNISARNVFKGKITTLTEGPINAEVEVTTTGGDKIVAIVTKESVQSLGMALGKEAAAFVKASWIILAAGEPEYRFSARNQLAGTVEAISKGAINSEVTLTLSGGSKVYSVVTNEAVLELGLKVGSSATALIKASHALLALAK